MIALGTSSRRAATGVPLRDNGVCAIDDDGRLFAVSEERLSGSKHDSDHHLALAAALDFFGRSVSDVSAVGVTSCTDAAGAPKDLAPAFDGVERLPLPSHHYSHALSAYASSGFASSLVLVTDAGGNTVEPAASGEWWTVPREQTTLWRAEGDRIELLERFHSEAGEIGYGEWFRAVTYFLGWSSHTLSGNTMALAGTGDPDALPGNLFEVASGLGLPFHPQRPVELVQSLLREIGQPLAPLGPGRVMTQGHRDLAAYLQRSLNQDVCRLVGAARERYGIANVCLSGGVAQNCVTNARLATAIGQEHLHVSPFAGDVGQVIGNALYARLDLGAGLLPVSVDRPFFGPEREHAPDRYARACAEVLARGGVVAVLTGRSEFGARALGQRSVLGDPCAPGVAHRIKTSVKRRNDFMPLAPVIHPNLGALLAAEVPVSRTMVYAPILPSWCHTEFGDALHFDQTARVQHAFSDSFVGQVLDAFRDKTGRSVLINTSYNQRGAPMVETLSDARAAFERLEIDALMLGREWLEK